MKRMWSAAIVIVAASAAVRAQSGKDMDKSMMGDKMAMTYTGCVESVNHGGSYLLTHLTENHQMSMGHDAKMKKDSGMMPSSLSKGSKDAGMKDEPDTLTVGSLKVVGKTCR